MGQPTESTPTPPLADRLVSLDAYRGFIMLAMVSAGLGTAKLRGDPQWGWLAHQLDHVKWEGCVFWDLIQPAFMFMVGVAMPLAFAKRAARGESWSHQFGHVVRRCLLLILIGIVMDSFGQDRPVVQFIRVLQQIAIGYFLAFFVLHLGPKVQALTAVLLLVGHTAAFLWYGGIGTDGPWQRDANVGTAIDQSIHAFFVSLGLPSIWPPSTGGNALGVLCVAGTGAAPHIWPPGGGGYVVINAISSTATILFGVLAGELIRGRLTPGAKALVLSVCGVGGILAGLVLENWVPMVKRIWTATFAVYAAGWTALFMAFFYVVIDIFRARRWSWPLVVVGMNSIFIYFCSGVLTGTIRSLLKPFTNEPLQRLLGSDYERWAPVVMALLVTFVLWLLCAWLYRKRIFFKV
jgi:heparan-alpha-glucosaminide N-acetyltransferase